MEQVLPKQLFWVRLDSGARIRAGFTSESRHKVVRLIVGDRVSVMIAHTDPNRGRIIGKLG